MKKIIIILSTVFVIVLSIIPTISAAVIPTTDFVPIYAIKLSDDSTFEDIPIWSLTYNDLGELPDGFEVYGYKNQYVQGDINNVLTLRDGSRFVYTSNGSTFSLVYRCVFQNGTDNGENNDFTVISNQSNSLDFIFVVTSQGYIGYTLFDNTDGNVFTTNITTIPLYTNVDDYYGEDEYENGYVDGYNTGFDEGYDSGYNRGYSSGVNSGKLSGYEEGYTEGVNVTNEQYKDTIEDLKEVNYINGYNVGYDDGVRHGTAGGYKEGYELGVIRGQEQSKIIPTALDGFWDSMVDFMSSFLSIGVGNLTLYSLLGVLLITFVTVIIVKVIRG